MSEWIKCSDRLPKDDQYVVAAHHYCDGVLPDMYVAWYINGRFSVCEDALEASNHEGGACITCTINVTHWMPIPPLRSTDP